MSVHTGRSSLKEPAVNAASHSCAMNIATIPRQPAELSDFITLSSISQAGCITCYACGAQNLSKYSLDPDYLSSGHSQAVRYPREVNMKNVCTLQSERCQ